MSETLECPIIAPTLLPHSASRGLLDVSSRGRGTVTDRLALDLAFALDKAWAQPSAGTFQLSARKGPSIPFSRASGATFIDSDGLVKWAPENLARYSEDFTNGTAWTGASSASAIANQAVAPNGTLTADRIVAGVGSNSYFRIQTTPSLTIGQRYEVSCYMKAGSVQYGFINVGNPVVLPVSAIFDLTGEGAVTLNAYGEASIETVGNGWYRCSVSGVAGSTILSSFRAGLTSSPESTSCVGTGAEDIYVWGYQCARCPNNGAYVSTAGSVAFAPRFEHDPLTGECLGLLCEEQRTNYILSSVYEAGWNVANCASTSEALGPVGKALKLTPAADTTNKVASPIVNIAFTAGSWSISTYAKANGMNFIALQENTSGGVKRTFFNLAAGTIATTAAGHTAGMVDMGGGWYRCSIVFTAVAGSFFSSICPSSDGASINPTGDGASGIYLAGAQWEKGNFPTSLIHTFGAVVTRSAEVAEISSPSFWNADQGALVVDGDSIGFQTVDTSFTGFLEGTSRRLAMYHRVAQGNRLSGNCSAGAITPTSGFNQALTRYRAAVAVKDGENASLVINGTIPATTAPLEYSALPADVLKVAGVSVTGAFNGRIRRLRYYRKRLPDSKLQTLTTPLINTEAPAINAPALVGEYVTADLGAWTARPTSYSFQWLLDGSPIDNSTLGSYVPSVSDDGHQLSVQVTAHRDGETSTVLTAAVTILTPLRDENGNIVLDENNDPIII